jgi:hypothetical protein
MSPTFVILCGVAAVCGVALGRLGVKDKTAITARRHQANQAAAALRAMGLTVLPPILEDYGVGDYASLLHRARTAVETFVNPEAVTKEFSTLFDNMLAKKMADPAASIELSKKVASLATGAKAATAALSA